MRRLALKLTTKAVKNEWIQVIRIKHLAKFGACKLACKPICKTTCKCQGKWSPRPSDDSRGERDLS